ncbi:hypothetical protein ABVK25_010567 [Lepraria finkii]|uniref:Uncharacterized protein n=1 Tax=Lepraria finkii TaxID=1340010 RepID=A0ABR4ATW5_9LECA
MELTKGIKRRRSDGEGSAIPARRKRSRKTKDFDSDIKLESGLQSTYEFLDETAKLYGQRSTGTSTPPTRSERSSLSNTSSTDEITAATETPASSVCTDIFDKLDPLLHDE